MNLDDGEQPLHRLHLEEELAVAETRNHHKKHDSVPRRARILVAEAHRTGRFTLERACRRVATDVHVVASWRNFAEVLDGLELLGLAPDLVILGDAFANRSDSEAIVLRRFPSARVLRLPTRSDGGLLAARALLTSIAQPEKAAPARTKIPHRGDAARTPSA